MPFDACGLGQLGPRFEVQSGRAIWRRAQAHLRVRGRPNQFARNPSALLRGELGRSTWSRNWRVARVISTFTLCQYEHALSQINKGIQVSFVHIVFASVAAVSNIGRPICRASGWAGVPRVCQGKQPGRRNRSSLEARGAPRAVAAYAASIWRPVQDGRAGKLFLSVLVDCRQLQVHARAARFKRPGATSGHSGCDGSDITRAVHAPEQKAAFARPKYRGTFIQGARSRGSQNRRGGDDGTRSLAVADRNSDPDHPADLAVWRPSRVKCALTSSQRAGSLRTAGFALFVCA